MSDDLTPLQRFTMGLMTEALGIDNPDTSGPAHLTPAERVLYNDSYTSSTAVYDENCYICRDPEFAQMGLPLCRECDNCKKLSDGRELGHIPADDTACTVCGHDEMEEYYRAEMEKHWQDEMERRARDEEAQEG